MSKKSSEATTSTSILIFGFLISMVTSYVDVSESAGKDVQLSVLSSCKSSATLSWSSRKYLKMCELTKYRTGQYKAEIIDIFPDSRNHDIQLSNLQDGERYTAFLVCDGTKRTNDVSFIVGDLCERGNTSIHSNKTSEIQDSKNIVQISRAESFSTAGWLSAAIFTCLGIILIVVVAYYSWRKYQHRQRILRIFRHEQSDPFQALYSPTQDSYSF